MKSPVTQLKIHKYKFLDHFDSVSCKRKNSEHVKLLEQTIKNRRQEIKKSEDIPCP